MECPVCFTHTEKNRMQYFSCNKHSTCTECYYKCHVVDQPYLLRCPICRAQHYREDMLSINNHNTYYAYDRRQYYLRTQHPSRWPNYINTQIMETRYQGTQLHSYLWRDICNTLIIHVSSIIIIMLTFKIGNYSKNDFFNLSI